MDPETAKLVVPGLFALGGVLVGGFVSYIVARVNVQGQRAVARDNAIRDDRKRAIGSIRERANRRLTLFRRLVIGTALADSTLRQVQNQLMFEDALLGDLSFSQTNDAQLDEAINELVSADEECTRQVLHLLGRYQQFESMSAEAAEQATAEWQSAVRLLVGPIARLNRAAELYVFGSEPKPWWRRWLPA